MIIDGQTIDEPTPVAPDAAVDLAAGASAPVAAFRCYTCGRPKSRRAARCSGCGTRVGEAVGAQGRPDGPAEAPVARTRLNEFRLYCFSCGRSTTVSIPPRRPGRCLTCGGTMAIEMETA